MHNLCIKVSVDQFGRFVIPKKIRDKFDIAPGCELELKEKDGHLMLELPTNAQLNLRNGLPVFDVGDDTDIRALIDVQRDARTAEILGDV